MRRARASKWRVFTTGEIADLVGISRTVVVRVIDSGDLHGYRLPGSLCRRVMRASLVRWLRRYQFTHALQILGENGNDGNGTDAGAEV